MTFVIMIFDFSEIHLWGADSSKQDVIWSTKTVPGQYFYAEWILLEHSLVLSKEMSYSEFPSKNVLGKTCKWLIFFDKQDSLDFGYVRHGRVWQVRLVINHFSLV